MHTIDYKQRLLAEVISDYVPAYARIAEAMKGVGSNCCNNMPFMVSYSYEIQTTDRDCRQ